METAAGADQYSSVVRYRVVFGRPISRRFGSGKKNGFKLENIVAVDSDETAVANARRAGCVAIAGDIHDIAERWTDGTIHGCIADYCCGLTYEQWWKSTQLSMCISGPVVLNFQRGRDSSERTITLRNALKRMGVTTKHRGEQFLLWHVLSAISALDGNASGKDHDTDAMCKISQGDREEVDALMKRAVREYSAVFNSYRSNTVVMDTIVWSFGRRDAWQRQQLQDNEFAIQCAKEIHQYGTRRAITECNKTNGEDAVLVKEILKAARLVQKLTAAKAVRTMRGAVRM